MTKVINRSRWFTAGASATVHTDETLTMPQFDGGPMIEVLPNQIEASYVQTIDSTWRGASVTIVGTPTISSRVTAQVSYTWSNVTVALKVLPGWAATFVDENTPMPIPLS